MKRKQKLEEIRIITIPKKVHPEGNLKEKPSLTPSHIFLGFSWETF